MWDTQPPFSPWPQTLAQSSLQGASSPSELAPLPAVLGPTLRPCQAPSSWSTGLPVSRHPAPVQASPEWLPFQGLELARCILGSPVPTAAGWTSLGPWCCCPKQESTEGWVENGGTQRCPEVLPASEGSVHTELLSTPPPSASPASSVVPTVERENRGRKRGWPAGEWGSLGLGLAELVDDTTLHHRSGVKR